MFLLAFELLLRIVAATQNVLSTRGCRRDVFMSSWPS